MRAKKKEAKKPKLKSKVKKLKRKVQKEEFSLNEALYLLAIANVPNNFTEDDFNFTFRQETAKFLHYLTDLMPEEAIVYEDAIHRNMWIFPIPELITWLSSEELPRAINKYFKRFGLPIETLEIITNDVMSVFGGMMQTNQKEQKN